jgi:pyruvate formate lyase activating enzyme
MNLPRVLDNFLHLVAEGVNVIPRVPLIPGYTLNETNMARVLAFLLPSGIRQLHLLPFHQYGEPKYRLLGQEWEMRQVAPPTEVRWQRCVQMAEREGFHVTVGG